MADSSKYKQGRILFLLVLVGMILTRLVWMDLRDYPISVDAKAHAALSAMTFEKSCNIQGQQQLFPQQSGLGSHLPDWSDSFLYDFYLSLSCDSGTLDLGSYVRMNQGVLILVILMCVFMGRFFSGSWLLCLSIAAVLLSRGRLIAANGDVSGQAMMMFLLTLWFCSISHWLRSGSRVMRIFVVSLPVMLAVVDYSLGFLSMTFFSAYSVLYLFRKPLTYPLFQNLRRRISTGRLRAATDAEVSESKPSRLRRFLGWTKDSEWGSRPLKERFRTGSLFRSLDVPFLLWIQYRRFWWQLLLGFFSIAAVQVVFLLLYSSQFWQFFKAPQLLDLKMWIGVFTYPLDLDLAASLIILAICLLLGPSRGLTSFWEAVWILFWVLFWAALGAYIWDSQNLEDTLRHGVSWKGGEILFWVEPILMSFAIIGVYHLGRCYDQYRRRGKVLD